MRSLCFIAGVSCVIRCFMKTSDDSKFVIDPVTGLLQGVSYVASPNYDERPANCAVDVIIIHAISLPPGCFGGVEIEQLFCNSLDATQHPYFTEICDLEVSAHFLIRRDGEIVQFVPVTQRAWHAGESSCLGRTQVNDFSIGIELEGCDEKSFDQSQYNALVDLTRCLFKTFPNLSTDCLFGHSDIAPGRKTDPGPCFDWAVYRAAL